MGREPFRLRPAVFWAATWGVGAGLGVALGGWLAVVGGAGAPGAGALDIREDVLLVPALAGGVVLVVHLVGQMLVASVRRVRSADPGGDGDEHREEREDDEIDREVGGEVEPALE
ncbi:MAG: hypothetical protein Q8K89_03465 [Actinomycetota bacterium]|nr:hypothetical protein [Actinomycetota bacterium]